MLKSFKTTVNAIVLFVFGVIIFINLSLIIQSYLYPDEVPDVFGISPLVVLSGSMSPTFDTNDLIFIQDVPSEELAVSDIVTYSNAGIIVTHRIVAKDDTTGLFTTQGDFNETVDAVGVSATQIQGKYIGHLDGVGAFFLFLQEPLGIVVCIIIPLTLLLLFDGLDKRKQVKAAQARSTALEHELELFKKHNMDGE